MDGRVLERTADPEGIAFRRWGGGGVRTIFVHGWAMSSVVWRPLGERLTRTLSAVAPDLLGDGGRTRSGGGCRLEDYAREVLLLADALGWRRFSLVGHSMGGAVAQRIAVDAPERVEALALLAPVPAGGLPLGREALAQFRGLAGDAGAMRAFLAALLVAPRTETLDELLEGARSVPREEVVAALESWTGADFAARVTAITAPTLVLSGEHDGFLTPALVEREVAARIPGAKHVVVRAAGHYLQIDRPDDVGAELARFLVRP